jgi:hypothetical protein|eukprot:31351-Pelagococcus_subviridis.AAC.8
MIRYHPSIHPLTTDPTSPRAILSTLSVPSQDGSQTMYIFEHWHEEADYAAYVATRGDKELMKEWDAAFGPCVAGPPTIKWFPRKFSVSNGAATW